VLLDRRRFETVGFRRFCTSGPQHCVDVSLLRQKDITREIHSGPQFAASVLYSTFGRRRCQSSSVSLRIIQSHGAHQTDRAWSLCVTCELSVLKDTGCRTDDSRTIRRNFLGAADAPMQLLGTIIYIGTVMRLSSSWVFNDGF
jgi:hypothetical protein